MSTLLFPPKPQSDKAPPPRVGKCNLNEPSWYLGTALVPMSMPRAEKMTAVEYR